MIKKGLTVFPIIGAALLDDLDKLGCNYLMKPLDAPRIRNLEGFLRNLEWPNTKIYNPYGINALNKFYIFLKNTYRSRSLHFRPLNP